MRSACDQSTLPIDVQVFHCKARDPHVEAWRVGCYLSRPLRHLTEVPNHTVFERRISRTSMASKPIVMLECGTHAREWSSVEVCLYFIYKLLKQKSEKVKKMTSMYDFIILPVMNPDGYVFSYTKDRNWRKNRRCDEPSNRCDGICVGVDLNRNFAGKFCSDQTSSPNRCSETYCGQNPFSEKETTALKKIVDKNSKNLIAYFCLHSFGAMWMSPYGKTDDLPEEYEELMRVAKAGAKAVKKFGKTSYEVGNIAHIIYKATGASVDYAYDKGNAKYAYAIELREGKIKKGGFILLEEEIIPLCQETFAGLQASILAMKGRKY
ncbi:mast cell carboxypeptidase A [Trichonephila clavipes]|nr:mast cell carboxypeptidase A [Trichonephila clavipes]